MFQSFNCPVDESAAFSAAVRPRLREGVVAQYSLRLRNLRLPFAVRLIARRGEHALADARYSGVLREGTAIDVPAYRSFHYHGATILDARMGHELHLLIRRDTSDMPAAAATTLSCRLAQEVFDAPALDWSLGFAAERMALPHCKFKAQLFREGSALTVTVREQRLMRSLLELTSRPQTRIDPGRLAAQLGFGNRARFEVAFHAHFGCSAAHFARHAWYPGLTWSAPHPFSSIDISVSFSEQEMQ